MKELDAFTKLQEMHAKEELKAIISVLAQLDCWFPSETTTRDHAKQVLAILGKATKATRHYANVCLGLDT